MFDVFYTNQKPNLFAFEQPAASLDDAAAKSRTSFFWLLDGNNDYAHFDFEFRPAPWESNHVHVWPTQWNQFGGAYFANKDTAKNKEWHFYKEIVTAKQTNDHWDTLVKAVEFDYSWTPHPMDPPYIYVFGNQWHVPERMPTVTYTVPGATERKYIYEPRAVLPPFGSGINWVTNVDREDPVEFDYSWVPDPLDPPYDYIFGNQHLAGEHSSTIEYRMPGALGKKYTDNIKAELGLLDMFYMDKSNISSTERYEKLLKKYPNLQKVRFANTNIDTIKRCISKAKTSRFWILSSENVYEDFNFDWHPDPWQHNFTHVFGSQWDKWSDTFLLDKREFERHVVWANTLAEFPNLNFVSSQHVKTGNDNFDMYFVEHGNPDNSLLSLKSRYPQVKVTRFMDNMLDALRRIMNTTKSEYVWVTSSLCDYTAFDFTWTPEPWQAEMIHCFGSEFQKRGDTFYIHVESFRKQMIELELLDWFNVICYHEENLLLRYDPEHVHYDSDNLVAEIMNHEFKGPYTMFMNRPGGLGFEPCVWTQKDRMVMSATPDNGVVAVPRDIKQYLKTQVYDYPFIDKSFNKSVATMDMDVVFISYDETDADKNWETLKLQCPRAIRLHGVEGMDNALKKAAEMCRTHWYYAVFAKTVVDPSFKFDFQPDLFQQPKHYIFHARNPMNGLEYGHMGIVMYNCNIVKNMTEFGIDYTMSSAHEVVPIVSAIAAFNTTPYQTWRTAFREVAKLSQFNDEQPSVENSYRLKTWTTKAEGKYAEWCMHGANDAVTFYKANSHDKAQLKNAFDWAWLKQYFVSLHGEVS